MPNLGHQQKLADLITNISEEVITACEKVEQDHPSWRCRTGDLTIHCAIVTDKDTGEEWVELNPSTPEPMQEIVISLTRIMGDVQAAHSAPPPIPPGQIVDIPVPDPKV